MSDARIRRLGDPITHAARWHDRAGGRAWCGPYFTLCHNDARIVEDDVDCMSCLVRCVRLDRWTKYQDFVRSLFKDIYKER